ncbi:hypothetical protein IWZ03DRAFT_391221 [Phyllosticta citriasiana]|uniref:Uncharacterized protein n=1 Tax=Phyllosticta citriasiana TaxID=595635 RepID=A0ABR1K8W2_9PEZI
MPLSIRLYHCLLPRPHPHSGSHSLYSKPVDQRRQKLAVLVHGPDDAALLHDDDGRERDAAAAADAVADDASGSEAAAVRGGHGFELVDDAFAGVGESGGDGGLVRLTQPGRLSSSLVAFLLVGRKRRRRRRIEGVGSSSSSTTVVVVIVVVVVVGRIHVGLGLPDGRRESTTTSHRVVGDYGRGRDPRRNRAPLWKSSGGGFVVGLVERAQRRRCNSPHPLVARSVGSGAVVQSRHVGRLEHRQQVGHGEAAAAAAAQAVVVVIVVPQRSGRGGGGAGRRGGDWRGLLVTVQMAAAVVFAVVSALVARASDSLTLNHRRSTVGR